MSHQIEPSEWGHPLEAIDWRLERSKEHLATLNSERRAVLDEENRRVVGQFERDTGEYVFRFAGKLPDPSIGIIVGEFAYHLRAALDNLLWQLVLLRGGSPTRETQFPIYESRERYLERAPAMLRGVSADDRTMIESIQPFQGGERAPDSYLALLAWLNNVDKHRFVHVRCVYPEVVAIDVSYGPEGEFAGKFPWNPIPVRDIGKILDVHYVPAIASDDRTELARVRFEPSGPDPEMKMRDDAPLDVALSDRTQALNATHLNDIYRLVLSIIESFRPRFNIVGGVT